MRFLIYVFGIVPALISWTISAFYFVLSLIFNSPYFMNLAITHDQNANAYLNGSPDETPSSRLGKKVDQGGWRYYLCKVLSFVLMDKNHCKKSIEEDEGK